MSSRVPHGRPTLVGRSEWSSDSRPLNLLIERSIMKKLLAGILLLVVSMFAHADFSTSLKEEFKEAHYGMHLLSDHANNDGTNNGNLGLYVRTKSGITVGHYKNSCNTYTNYYGWSTPEWYRLRVTPVIASGYHCLTERQGISEGRRWNLTIVPTVRIATWENIAGLQEVSIRGMFVPGLYHLMAEVQF